MESRAVGIICMLTVYPLISLRVSTQYLTVYPLISCVTISLSVWHTRKACGVRIRDSCELVVGFWQCWLANICAFKCIVGYYVIVTISACSFANNCACRSGCVLVYRGMQELQHGWDSACGSRDLACDGGSREDVDDMTRCDNKYPRVSP